MPKDLRAFSLGLLVFAGLSPTYLALATRGSEQQSSVLGWLATASLYSAPFFAGFAYSLLAPSRPVATLLALGIVAAALFGAMDFAWAEIVGHMSPSELSKIGWIVGMSVVAMPLLVVAGVR
jgi:hypothetical protein